MRTDKTAKNLYLKKLFAKKDPILQKLTEQAQKEKVDHMQISHYEGGILQFLCRALSVKKAVEIGTLYAYSGLMIARSLPEDGELFTLDRDKQRQETAKALIQKDPSSKKITFVNGPALESLRQLENKNPFDMVFIDADKEGYLDYLDWSYNNLKPGGLVVADNTFLFGAIYGEPKHEIKASIVEIMKKFNESLASCDRFFSTIIPTAEGLSVGMKKE